MNKSKRLSAIALAAVLGVFAFSVFSASANNSASIRVSATPDETVKHDVNMDGEFNVKDAAAIQKHIAGYDVKVDENELDVNNDGKKNIQDATKIQKLLAGIAVEEETQSELTNESEDIGDWF